MNIKILIIALLTFTIFVVQQVQALEFIMKGRVNEMYDDNINTSPDNPESDWVTNMIFGMALKSEGKVSELALAGNIYQKYCVSHENMNDFYQDLMFAVNKRFYESFSIKVSDTLNHYPSAQSFDTLFGGSESTGGYLQNDFASGLTVYTTMGLFFTGVYNNSIRRNDSDIILDSFFNSPGAIAGYYFNSANIVRIGYQYSLMKYEDNSETKGQRNYAEYEMRLTSQIWGIVEGGYDYVENTAGESLNSRYRISLMKIVDERNQFDISFLKESTISNINNDTFNFWRISGSLKREVSSRTSINIAMFYGDGVYEESKVRDKLGGVSFGVALAFSESMNFNAGYIFSWSKVDNPEISETSYRRNQVYIGVSGEY